MGTRFNSLAQRFNRYRKYRDTLHELDQLSERELDDLGMHRSNVRQVARLAAYDG
ncbi:MAG: DUF1127 domain-containing protein [Silicimonas sp.]|jgi:uncharacterized protein YjiS (DUF1127 family)|nr:DUF1127 domain-containing protein [Silicimonas sp.]